MTGLDRATFATLRSSCEYASPLWLLSLIVESIHLQLDGNESF